MSAKFNFVVIDLNCVVLTNDVQLISAGKEYECSEEILSIAAVLSVQSVFNNNPEMRNQIDAQKRKFAVYEGDHLTLLNGMQ
jgi:HrpA-like RNA helicase